MFSNDTLRSLALEILKAKCDLSNSPNSEIFSSYLNIWNELRECNAKVSENKSAVQVLK